ncbi:hypothetical protein [Kordia sp.]|uniref:hypothetical protein n=1 Tax=Kordia sp. TaxID=1965332 RepID=UPI003B59D5A7
MKKLLLLITFTLGCLISVNAQARVGTFYIQSVSHKKLNKKVLANFKKTKTYFVFLEEDSQNYNRADYEKILKEVWNVTPFEIITEDEVYDVAKEKSAFAQFKAFSISKTGKSGAATRSYHVLDFWLLDKVKKINKEKDIFRVRTKRVGAIYFTPDIKSRQQVVIGADTITGDLMNYRLGYIKNYLQRINNGLKRNESFDMFDDYLNKEKLGTLKNKTLYMSEDFIYSYSPWGIKEKKNQMTPEKLFKDYKHSYKIISDNELNDKILNNEDFYYLMYNQNVGAKVISVINGKTGEVIYNTYKNFSYNLKPKNIKLLSKKISKY